MKHMRTLCPVIVAFVSSVAVAGAAERPNFLVILCDDLGWGDLACYGHPHIRTPNLDRLAREGVRLTSCYCAAPVCSPSRVGLLTGRVPDRAGVYDWIPEARTDGRPRADGRDAVHLRRGEVTLPSVLKQVGYATAMSGKWHCNSMFNRPEQPQPGDAGFDHWFATQNNATPSHENPVNFVRNGVPVGPLTGFSCRLVAREVINWLDDLRRREPARPFFAYVAFHEPHEPVASPPDLVRHYADVARNDNEAQYFANVENMDGAVGELLDALERLRVATNTLVFFSSDNGPETLNRYQAASRCYGSAGPLRGRKLWTTEGGIRVPGILRWPARVAPGRVCDEPISSLDLLPTFARLAGAVLPAGLELDGTDLTGWLAGAPLERRKPLYWAYYNAINDQRIAMRDGPWKVLARLEDANGAVVPRMENITEATVGRVRAARLGGVSVFRLPDDVGESRDLSRDLGAQRDELQRRLEQLHQEIVASMHVWPAPKAAIGAATGSRH
ncbi:MAG: sulfatase-like hydrolase/transferase [Kiritimatiellae bacterium]|nr:sulfatase-like hydrolase/transferase [Kiritimatiellia bacterium]